MIPPLYLRKPAFCAQTLFIGEKATLFSPQSLVFLCHIIQHKGFLSKDRDASPLRNRIKHLILNQFHPIGGYGWETGLTPPRPASTVDPL
jgi:hypothetical protein